MKYDDIQLELALEPTKINSIYDTLIRIKDKNIGEENGCLTIPHYMVHLLFDWSPIFPIE